MVAAQHLLPFLTNPVHFLLISVLLLICLAISAFKLSFRVPVDLLLLFLNRLYFDSD